MTDGLEDTHVHDPLLSRVIAGKMELRQVLGAGAMGVVYRAHHLALDKQIAIKVLKSEGKADPTRARRFKAEARAASRLDHPNSVHILDFGEDGPDGLLYLAMEFLEGEDLQSLLRRERVIAPDRAARIMVQVLGALAAAHDSGVIHRDMKPGNVMLLRRTDDDGQVEDFVKVCDFGLAKILDGLEDASGAPLTKQGSIFGTPSYMSPEQARGETLDGRTDVYACGVIFYKMLTGEAPFSADSAWGILMKHLNDPVPPMSQWVKDVPPELVRITERALVKDRAQRFQSAREMRAAVKAYLKDAGEDLEVSAPQDAMAPIQRSPSLTTPALPPRAGSRTSPAVTEAGMQPPARADRTAAPLAEPGARDPGTIDGGSVSRMPVSRSRGPVIVAALAAAVVLAGGGWWMMRAPVVEPIAGEPLAVVPSPAASMVASASPSMEPLASASPSPSASPSMTPEPVAAASPMVPVASPSASPADEEDEPTRGTQRRSRTRAQRRGSEASPEPTRAAEPAPTATPSAVPLASPAAPSASPAAPASSAAPTPSASPAAAPAPLATAAPSAPPPAKLGPLTTTVTNLKVTGGMSGRKVQEGLAKGIEKARKCVEAKVQGGAKLTDGVIDVRGTVDLRGRLSGVKAVGTFGPCVSEALEGAALPKPDTGEALLSFTLELKGS